MADNTGGDEDTTKSTKPNNAQLPTPNKHNTPTQTGNEITIQSIPLMPPDIKLEKNLIDNE